MSCDQRKRREHSSRKEISFATTGHVRPSPNSRNAVTPCPPSTLSRLYRLEAQACRIEHQNIVMVTDFVEDEHGRLLYVMEFLEGPTLAQRLEVGTMPVARVLPLVTQPEADAKRLLVQ